MQLQVIRYPIKYSSLLHDELFAAVWHSETVSSIYRGYCEKNFFLIYTSVSLDPKSATWEVFAIQLRPWLYAILELRSLVRGFEPLHVRICWRHISLLSQTLMEMRHKYQPRPDLHSTDVSRKETWVLKFWIILSFYSIDTIPGFNYLDADFSDYIYVNTFS